MKIGGYKITEKRIAVACAIMLLTVSLLAAIKQADAAANVANLLDDKKSQKTTQSTEQRPKPKPNNDFPQQFVPQKNKTTDSATEKRTDNNTAQNGKADTTEKKNTTDDQSKNSQPPADKPKSQSSGYTYTVQDGDSYSTVIRRAISEHGGASLNAAQKIAAETKLVEQAGWPEVDAGQSVKIDSTALSQAVSSARAMTADEQQSWQAYADDIVW